MKYIKSVEEERPKTMLALGLLSAVVGVALFVFYPEAGTPQETISDKELGVIHFAGVILMFVGFYFAFVLLPVPKTKK